MKKLLLIGGTGFLGKSFLSYLNNSNLIRKKLSEIIILSRRKKKIYSKIKISFISKNIVNLKSIPVTDYIIYAVNSKNNEENIEGVLNFKNLLNEKHKKTKILFTSSGAVYGKIDKIKKIKESDLVSIQNVQKFKGYKRKYAISKIKMEREFKILSKKGFNVSVARLFSFIGNRILKNKNFAITNLISQAKNKNIKVIKLSDTKDVYRGYMESNELIKWLFKILMSSNKNFNIYNVGSDEAITIENLAKLIGKKFNKKIFKLKRKNIKDVDYYVPSVLKAKKELNLKINFKLKKSLNELLKNINKKS
jgi:nucleoside-diphosphate-sugar epimerase